MPTDGIIISKDKAFSLRKRGKPCDLPAPESDDTVNENLRAIEVDTTLYPSIATMLNNSTVIIDTEIRRLMMAANSGGLRPEETKQFEKYAAALCRVAKLSLEVKENNPLDSMTDTELLSRVAGILSVKETQDGETK